MEYIMVLIALLYFSYYLLYKYILEFGISMIFWSLYSVSIFILLPIIFPVSKFIYSLIIGNGIILYVLIIWVIITHDEIIEMIIKWLKGED